MKTHMIEPERRTLHGKWSGELAPAVVIDAGDSVEWRGVLDVTWGCGQHDRQRRTRDKWQGRQSPRDDGPALHGPVFVRGVAPGDTLVVTIDEIVVGRYGWTCAGHGPFNRQLNEALGIAPEQHLLLWDIDADSMTATSEHGLRLALRPFFGTIGLCPAGPGWHEGWFPTPQGGNMDCAALVAGSTLHFPVAHPGGLLSLGDAHARQGDGELSGSAIECMVSRARLTFDVRRDLSVSTVTAETPLGWVTAGFDRDLDAAVLQAVSAMLDLMERLLGVDRTEAMLLASSLVDLRITQLVNGVRGVHAVLSPDALL